MSTSAIRVEIDHENTLDAIQRAAYRWSDIAHVGITFREEKIIVRFEPVSGALPPEFESQFRSQLIDEALRERVLAETRHIRDHLVQQAFAGAVRPNGLRRD